jgi:hypothetical protein
MKLAFPSLLRVAASASVIALGAISAPCAADVWGYVDDNGVAHLADFQVNDRYMLFKKEAPRPAKEAFVPPPIFVPPAFSASGGVIQVSPAMRAQMAPLIAQVA